MLSYYKGRVKLDFKINIYPNGLPSEPTFCYSIIVTK